MAERILARHAPCIHATPSAFTRGIEREYAREGMILAKAARVPTLGLNHPVVKA